MVKSIEEYENLLSNLRNEVKELNEQVSLMAKDNGGEIKLLTSDSIGKGLNNLYIDYKTN